MSETVTTVDTYTTRGIGVIPVQVEVTMLRRLPTVCIIGLPASAVREVAERVRSAIEASGFEFPRTRVVINLAPADVRKDACAMDLPIALAILIAAGHLTPTVAKWAAVGELSLDGRVRPVRGVYPLVLSTGEDTTGEDMLDTLLVPEGCGNLAPVAGAATRVIEVRTLADALDALTNRLRPGIAHKPWNLEPTTRMTPDFAEIPGNFQVLPALVRAAAMGHGVLLQGPPGCGKSMLAHRLPGILPQLTQAEASTIASWHSAANMPVQGNEMRRPFRAPHHTVSSEGLLGDRLGRPGELDLARGGVLFLDELTEFRRSAQDNIVRWMHANPGQVQLVAAIDPRSPLEWEDRIIAPLRALLPLELVLERPYLQPIEGAAKAPSSADLREQVIALRKELS